MLILRLMATLRYVLCVCMQAMSNATAMAMAMAMAMETYMTYGLWLRYAMAFVYA